LKLVLSLRRAGQSTTTFFRGSRLCRHARPRIDRADVHSKRCQCHPAPRESYAEFLRGQRVANAKPERQPFRRLVALALTTRYLPQRPTLRFVGFNNIHESGQLGFLRRIFGAAHQRVGSPHEHRVRCLGHLRKLHSRSFFVAGDPMLELRCLVRRQLAMVCSSKFDRCATICVKCSARLRARLGKATSAPGRRQVVSKIPAPGITPTFTSQSTRRKTQFDDSCSSGQGTPRSPDWTVFRVLPDAFHMRNALSFSGALCDATRAIHLFADPRRVDWSGGWRIQAQRIRL
jgi:hypothetical protein